MVPEPDLASYDHFIVAFSGGKDSLACVLHLLDLGVPRDRIELWHHDVDGQEGSRLMDWPVTRDYCRAVAEALEIPLYFSWKVGGFEREMRRDGTATAPTRYEAPLPGGRTGLFEAGGNGPPGTRLKFPQVAADLKVRWCSAYLKIDVGSTALRNQKRFVGARTLFVTGERAEESSARAKYKTFEPHRSDSAKRHVDQWRPIHQWPEQAVWDIIKAHHINPHPAYHLGFGRVSCAACNFRQRGPVRHAARGEPRAIRARGCVRRRLRRHHQAQGQLARAGGEWAALPSGRAGNGGAGVQREIHRASDCLALGLARRSLWGLLRPDVK